MNHWRRTIVSDSEDSEIQYHGQWARVDVNTPDKSFTYTTHPNDTATIIFNGTEIQVWGIYPNPPGTQHSTYVVDRGVPTIHIPPEPIPPRQRAMFFSQQDLHTGTHTLIITNLGDSLWLNYVEIAGAPLEPTTMMTVPPAASTVPFPTTVVQSIHISPSTRAVGPGDNPTKTSIATQLSHPPSTDAPKSTPKLVGGVIGAAICILLLASGGWLWRRRKTQIQRTQTSSMQRSTVSERTVATYYSSRIDPSCTPETSSSERSAGDWAFFTSDQYPVLVPIVYSDPDPDHSVESDVWHDRLSRGYSIENPP
ncbi:hypothetical protein C8Q80DRAFT_442760 [Daedaleopsis nitida]|nr:hypothetical protein C8Q80DRAFT_442760 [Daedaleopsis nitida]